MEAAEDEVLRYFRLVDLTLLFGVRLAYVKFEACHASF